MQTIKTHLNEFAMEFCEYQFKFSGRRKTNLNGRNLFFINLFNHIMFSFHCNPPKEVRIGANLRAKQSWAWAPASGSRRTVCSGRADKRWWARIRRARTDCTCRVRSIYCVDSTNRKRAALKSLHPKCTEPLCVSNIWLTVWIW